MPLDPEKIKLMQQGFGMKPEVGVPVPVEQAPTQTPWLGILNMLAQGQPQANSQQKKWEEFQKGFKKAINY